MSLIVDMNSQFPSNKHTISDRKLRGGYYTPEALANYLTAWAIRSGSEHILEPSCGDGRFIRATLRRLEELSQFAKIDASLTAVELDPNELEKARSVLDEFPNIHLNSDWIASDFFEAYTTLQPDRKFDVLLGNPPFIRFQHFDDTSRNRAFTHLRNAGYHPTKLANAWVAFVQLGIELLETGGRLAMVVPAELLQVTYTNELRERLTRQFEHIIVIGFERLVFPDIQQEVVLLLAEDKRERESAGESDIHTVEFADGWHLTQSERLENLTAHIPAKHSRNGMKWTALFLKDESFRALDEVESHPDILPLGKLANVAVGIVTGRNQFFVLTKGLRDELNAIDYTIPLVGRTGALKSIAFTPDDFAAYRLKHPAYLLDLNDRDVETIPPILRDYLKIGEKNRIHLGYKCRIRKRWFDVPSIYVPDAFLFRQIHRYPLLVLNKAQAVSTDTIHRVRFRDGVNGHLLAAIAFNSLTLAWAEVCGRSYGGGVLELEPNEAKKLPIPYAANIDLDVKHVDSLLRAGQYEDALDYVDQRVLIEHFRFDSALIQNIRNAWIELRDRRINRKPQ